MPADNPYNNLKNRPDRHATAVVATIVWGLLAGVLAYFAHSPLQWMAVVLLGLLALRTWWRRPR